MTWQWESRLDDYIPYTDRKQRQKGIKAINFKAIISDGLPLQGSTSQRSHIQEANKTHWRPNAQKHKPMGDISHLNHHATVENV